MKNKKLDREKILSKIDELDSFIEEIEKIKPVDFEEYKTIEKKRSIERLFQISIETVIDICNILNSNLKLGIPNDEDNLAENLENNKIISKKVSQLIKEMKGFRNILVHKYGKVDDEIVFENLDKLSDFELFKKEILDFLKKSKY
ncbi:DUF86 domain-containing protein [Candidatus Pacearchaeota archaeon]|nr:DUF86 domain-containing protein [Candidatus Pacearchaeota archaeon]